MHSIEIEYMLQMHMGCKCKKTYLTKGSKFFLRQLVFVYFPFFPPILISFSSVWELTNGCCTFKKIKIKLCNV